MAKTTTPPKPPEACGNCLYSRLLNNQAGKPDLFCRRYPKQAILQITTHDGALTKTGILVGHTSVSPEHDWCGEYEYSPEKKNMPVVGSVPPVPTQ